jgi:hypothetical protein
MDSIFFSLKIPQFLVGRRLISDKLLKRDGSFRMIFRIDIDLARSNRMERLEKQGGENDQQ